MSMRRFVGYFFALSACSTVAFASCMVGQAMPPDVAQAPSDAPFASFHVHRPALSHPSRHAARMIALLSVRQ